MKNKLEIYEEAVQATNNFIMDNNLIIRTKEEYDKLFYEIEDAIKEYEYEKHKDTKEDKLNENTCNRNKIHLGKQTNPKTTKID